MANVEVDLPQLEVRDGVDRETIETVASMGAYKYGWATDIDAAFAAQNISPTTQHLCSVLAVAEQDAGADEKQGFHGGVPCGGDAPLKHRMNG